MQPRGQQEVSHMRSGLPTRLSGVALASALALAGGACGDNDHGPGGEGPGEPPPGGTVPGAAFRRVDLVSDQQGLAPRVASELVNPWGIARGEGGFWIADEGSGAISIFNAAGEPAHGEYTSGAINLGAGITGIAANPTDGFRIRSDSVCCTPAEFVIASMGGRLFGVS